MIQLSKLELKNFLSHTDTSILFKDYEGLVLIEGQSYDGHYSSNGSGKSTLLEGIVYALTGDTLRGVAVNDVINRNAKKNTKVSLEFLKDNLVYSASRYRKDDKLGDNLVLLKSDEDISKRVNKETQKSLEDILNISYKILVSTILLGEGLSSRFTQLSDPEKKSLIESTLNLNYDLGKSRELANGRIKELRLQSATVEGEINTLKGLSELDTTQFEDCIHDSKECIRICQETITHLKEDASRLTSEIDNISPKLTLINNTLNSLSTLERDREIKADEFHRKNAEMQHILSSATPVCSLCHQALASSESKNAVLDKYKVELDALYKEIANIDVEISKMPEKSLLKQKAESLNLEYTEKSNKYREIIQDIGNYERQIVVSQKDIEYAENSLASAQDCELDISEKEEMLRALQKDVAKYDYFYKLFSPTGIIVSILSEAVNYINDRLSTYSEVLLEKDYKIQFLKGKISLVDSKGSSYQSLSNGEKRRLDIAIQFSLHDYVCTYCGNTVDTMFIDEILDTLDDVGIENIITVLRLKLEYCKLSRIFVISHNSELKSYFDNVITVYKDAEGNSKILE